MTKSNKSALFFCRIFSALHSIEKVVKNKIIRTIFGAGLIAIASSASAEDLIFFGFGQGQSGRSFGGPQISDGYG